MVTNRPDMHGDAAQRPSTETGDSDRRFTDQEVALVLQRAAELEEQRSLGSTSARGLTLRELHEIAREVGLSAEVIDEAVAAVRAGVGPHRALLLGAPLSSKVVRGVPGRLGEDALQRLVRVIEDHVDATGTVTEALGTVRWTSVSRGHKFDRTTQVSLSSTDEETQIQVVQRYPSGLRAILHFLPGTWGGVLGAGVAASAGIAPLAVIGVAAGAAVLGASIGRTIWQTLAKRSEREVERMATQLVTAAGDMV
ncbi:MAG: hypothetical protein OEO20_12355 [Gemmatimonadota bacterium]|nr:hypothetical protein [Gemmatimonadota bacterium]MDH3366475.1 hypothetical protein [Gemmatimonadota bacterium]MDH3479086.1 hypothetical protein [Gemmatimonadota bacterium]MDH3571525.1 hypothetical protein [Gemmatimonadota bacterium]MDH5549600.1 hypothetical protein [Gemmatimonadota bacterium]